MKTLNEIKEIVRRHQPELSRRYQIRVIGVFGSYARGEQQTESDVDLLVEVEGPISLFELAGAQVYLSEILKLNVDLVPKEDVRPELKEHILSEAIYL